MEDAVVIVMKIWIYWSKSKSWIYFIYISIYKSTPHNFQSFVHVLLYIISLVQLYYFICTWLCLDALLLLACSLFSSFEDTSSLCDTSDSLLCSWLISPCNVDISDALALFSFRSFSIVDFVCSTKYSIKIK